MKSQKSQGFWSVYGKEWDKDVITPLWSMSKALTAIGIIKLLEEGKLELDDEVKKYIPEFKTPQVCSKVVDGKCVLVDAESEITIRQCITHTSGLSYAGVNLLMSGIVEVDRAYRDSMFRHMTLFPQNEKQLLELLTKNPLICQPGTGFHYNNGIDLAGAVISRITKGTLYEYVKKKIFDPLEMNDTKFKQHISWKDWRNRTAEPFVTPIKHHVPFNVVPDTNYQMGGQGFYSTLSDYKKFQLMLVNDGKNIFNGKVVFKKETVDK